VDKSGAGARFLRELQFPLPIYIPSASPQSSSLSPEAGTIGKEARSGRSANSLTNHIKKIIWLNLMISFQFSVFLSVTQDPNQLAVAP
jgi:hypothetical protein